MELVVVTIVAKNSSKLMVMTGVARKSPELVVVAGDDGGDGGVW